MKTQKGIFLILLSLLTFSCVDSLTDYGTGVRPGSDAITIGADTFHLETKTVFIDSIVSQPDSFLLGSFYNAKYGSTKADILAQLNCPVGFKFPAGAIPDSAVVVLYYKSWFGDTYSPMNVSVYEMNKSTFSFTGLYPSNLDPRDYSDMSVLLGSKIFTARDASKLRKDSSRVYVKLGDSFKDRFFDDTKFGSETAFTNFFKGIYITTDFGTSTIMNIARDGIYLEFTYHYTYTNPETHKLDTVVNRLFFPANKEVRQVNRFLHSDRNDIVKLRDSINYVASPANMQTQVLIPLKRIKAKMDANSSMNGKKQLLNKALLEVVATEVEDSTLAMPIVRYMLLVKESNVKKFFKNEVIPTSKDTSAILGQLTATEIGTTGKYKYSYVFDVSGLISNELKNASESNTVIANNVAMSLIPVSVSSTTSSSGSVTITAVKHQGKMSAVTIRSGKVINSSNKEDKVTEPMHIKLVYSGF